MAKLKTEIVYNGKDNTIDLVLLADGEAVDLSPVTQIILDLDGTQTVEDSASTAWPIKWTGLGTTGKIMMKLGDEGLDAGSYNEAKLEVYDPSNSNGLVWGLIPIKIKD